MDRHRKLADAFTQLHAKRFGKFAIPVVLVLAAMVLLQGIWSSFKEPTAEGNIEAIESANMAGETRSNSSDPSNQPAGVPTGTLPGAESSLSKVPQALRLVSTNPGRSPREGSARLGTHPENPQTYVAGALLVNGSRLAEIHSQYVVLERTGQRSKLYLASSGSPSPSPLSMVGGEPAPKAAVSPYSDALVQYLRPSPVFEGDRLKGYQVYPGPRSTVFAQLGLQSGDVILALDGQPFGDPQQAVESLRQLTSGVTMIATIERRGQVERVTLEGHLVLTDQQKEQIQPIGPPAMAGM